jgi:formylglycine-generating enzyme required for sulfatase activity
MHRPLRSLIWVLGSVGAFAACNGAGLSAGGDGTNDPTQATSPTDDSDSGAPRPPCATNGECASGSCSNNRCDAPPSTGDSGTPPPPACGKATGTICKLGMTCASNDDCVSGLCGTDGANKNKCVSAKSCTGGLGADVKGCTSGTEDCCESIAVPGGAFTNYDNSGSASAATVAAFKLDKFEITVGRLRAFYKAMNGALRDHPPAPGAGKHPKFPNSGWRASFNVRLPNSWTEINNRMLGECAVGGDPNAWGAPTWSETAGANEDKPANCVDWYTLSAFCAWDGGRLPTDAEWSYVAFSGSEQRAYPWGNDVAAFGSHHDIVATSFNAPGETYGHYTEGPEFRQVNDGPLHIAHVGTKTARSKWGHSDMGGNVIEFTSEMAHPIGSTCDNCANFAYPDPPQGTPVQPLKWQPLDANGNPPPSDTATDFDDSRAIQDGKRLARGGSWQGEFEGHWLANVKNRHWYPLWRTYSALGARCARDL